jgi:hypothetical protein
MDLGFVVLCIFDHSNKTPNQIQQSIIKFYYFVVQTLLSVCTTSNKILRLIVVSGWVFYLSDQMDVT